MKLLARSRRTLTEAVKNVLLIAASTVFLFDGTLIQSSATAANQRSVTVAQIERKAELDALPKILEATKPEEFHEIVESLQAQKPKGKDFPTRKAGSTKR